jgi:hypothetical protein
MTTKIKIINQTVLLIGSFVMAAVISNLYLTTRDVLSDLNLLIFSQLAIGYFAILSATYFIKIKSVKSSTFQGLLRGGIYASIIILVLLIAKNVYYEWHLFVTLPEPSTMKTTGGYATRAPQDFLRDNYLLFILIITMIFGVRINKSLGADTKG